MPKLDPAIEAVLAAYDNNTYLGKFIPDDVLESLEAIAGEAMEQRGNMAFLVANLVQAGRINDALLVIAKEARRRNDTELTQALELLVKSLVGQNGNMPGGRRFTPRKPHEGRGNNDRRPPRRPQENPTPRDPQHARTDDQTNSGHQQNASGGPNAPEPEPGTGQQQDPQQSQFYPEGNATESRDFPPRTPQEDDPAEQQGPDPRAQWRPAQDFS